MFTLDLRMQSLHGLGGMSVIGIAPFLIESRFPCFKYSNGQYLRSNVVVRLL